MPTTRELHQRAMELMDEALYVIKPAARLEELSRENFLVEMRFRQALKFETYAAASVSNRFELEPLDSARGMIERNLRRGGFSGYRVVVNQAYPEEDQRVASAHELSHFLKDRNRFTDRLVDNRMYSSGLANHVEQEADKIALD